jgi:hypothetical protein
MKDYYFCHIQTPQTPTRRESLQQSTTLEPQSVSVKHTILQRRGSLLEISWFSLHRALVRNQGQQARYEGVGSIMWMQSN